MSRHTGVHSKSWNRALDKSVRVARASFTVPTPVAHPLGQRTRASETGFPPYLLSSGHPWRSIGIPAWSVSYCTITTPYGVTGVREPYAHAPTCSLPPSSTQPVLPTHNRSTTGHAIDKPRSAYTVRASVRSVVYCIFYALQTSELHTNPGRPFILGKPYVQVCVCGNVTKSPNTNPPSRLAVEIRNIASRQRTFSKEHFHRLVKIAFVFSAFRPIATKFRDRPADIGRPLRYPRSK